MRDRSGSDVVAVKRVLVPLDGSALAEQAMPYAAALAERFGASVRLLYAFDGLDHLAQTLATRDGELDRTQFEQMTRSSELALTQMRAYLDAQAERLAADDVTVDTLIADVIRDGRPSGAILEEAHRELDTIVVMTTHGRGGLGRLIFGSTANEVLQKAGVPIMLIRATPEGSTDAEAR